MSFLRSLPRPTKIYHSTTYDRIAKHHGFVGEGKTVLITGGATGVGYSISKAFAGAGIGRIAIISRTLDTQQKAKVELEAAYPATQVVPYQASITDHARMNEIIQDLGSIDILILCASVYHSPTKAVDLTVQDVQDCFDTNTFAAFNLTQMYLNAPTPVSGHKKIIHISSAAGQMRSPLRVGYGPSKAAVTQMMQHFALEQKSGDVRIFSFHPGAFYTPATKEIYSDDAFEWEDINLPAHFALWLAGPESDFLHGRYVWAHWDVDELIGLKGKLAEDSRFLTIGLVL